MVGIALSAHFVYAFIIFWNNCIIEMRVVFPLTKNNLSV